jgi:hypothetical protein
LPDDAVDVEVDKRILIEFFLDCKAKKIRTDTQCFLLSTQPNYISVSRTARAIVIQSISDHQSTNRTYYGRDCADWEQIARTVRSLAAGCGIDKVPVLINSINNDMQQFRELGRLVSLPDMIANSIEMEKKQ